jgi:CheY-like chemotaxis protein
MALFIRDNGGGKRLGLDRRQFSYDKHIPECRSDKDRRNGLDRRLKPRTPKKMFIRAAQLQKRMIKIMIVENEAVIALRLQQRLTSMGFDVVGVAYSGEEVVETARDLRPDLILTDIMIPGKLDGIQVAEIVKSALDIPVIFLTAYSQDKIIERTKQVEPNGYIVKPFQNREIKAAIEVALYKKDMERQLKESKI